MKRVIVILLVLAVAIGTSVAGYTYLTPAKPQSLKDDKTIKVETIGRDTLLDSVMTTGRLEPKAEVEMKFEIGGVVSEVLVQRGQSIQAGAVLARLKTDDLQLAIKRAEIDLAQQQSQLDKLFEPQLAEKITAAQARIESARLKLEKLQAGPDKEEIAKAEVELKRKEIALKEAQWAYDEVAYRGDIAAMPQANQLQTATLEYESALADYTQKTRGPTADEVAEARSALADAKAALAELQQKPSPADITNRQAAVDMARIALAEKKRDLERAVLVAPTAGVVLDVNIEPGERVLSEAADPALIIADTSAYLLKAEVDELDISRIAHAQTVVVTLDAIPEREFNGQVADISPRPVKKEANAIVTYEVVVKFGAPDEAASLLPGMTANATIETKRLENVVVVPNQAIQTERQVGKFTTYVEKLDEKGNPVKTEIELGLRGEQVTQVLSGLKDGDQVVIHLKPGEQTSTPEL